MAIPAIDYQLLANAGSPPVSFKAGELIFAAGDKGDKMYVVRSGTVEIERDGKIVETVTAGGIFGEMALIDGAPRAATARAKTECEVAPIAEKNFLFLVHETPYFAIAVMRSLAEGCGVRRRRKP
jgi:CRP/FNR family transcriptional regulator, cyclic AMP receptor protein